MENKYNEATAQRPQGDRVMDALMVPIDLTGFVKQVRDEKTWKDNDRNAITVFKTSGMRIVLIALHSGAEMNKHTADGLISIQVLEGKMLFTADEQTVELSKDRMLALHKGVPHSLVAKEETIFLLTLAGTSAEK